MKNICRKILSLGAGLLLALPAFGGIAPRQDYASDCATPATRRTLTFQQAGSQDLGWTFKQGTVAKDLTGATQVLFTYTPVSREIGRAHV